MKTPICNTETGKIIGCKNKHEYKHEKNHIEFSKSEKGMKVIYFQQLSEFWTIIFLVTTLFIPIFKWFTLITGLVFLFCWIYEEIWCDLK